MAQYGSSSVKFTQWDSLKFSWEIDSQSAANNSSVVDWKLELVSTQYGRIEASARRWYITVNGNNYTDTEDISIGNNATKVLGSGTTTIPHTSSSAQSFSWSFRQEINITFDGEWIGEISGSGSGVLDAIPRASQPSCITWPEHTQNVGYFGDEISIHMNRKDSNFTHTVRYAFGSLTGTIATGVGTGTTWVIPNSFMDLLPASTSGSGTIYVDTYNGSSLVGTKYCGFTAKVRDSVKPSCTVQVLDNTNILDTYGNLVKGLSKLYVKVNGYPAYSSPIHSYNVTANGTRYTKNEIITGFLTSAGTTKVTATVTDKRGRTSAVAEASFPVLDYSAPNISALSVHRCNEDGTANDQGSYVRATFSASVTALNNKNTAVYKLKYKKSSSTSYTTITLSDLANKYSAFNYTYTFEADINSSYDVEVTVQDRHNTSSRSTSASTAFTLMNFNPQGNGIGVGQVCEKQNTFQCGLDFEVKGKSIVDIVYPVGSIYLAYNHTNPGTLFPGTTWTRIYGAFPWFTDANGAIGLTGGERTVTLTADQIPAHNHGGTYTNAGTARTHAWLASGGSAMGYDTVSAGGGEAHNNMPPYIQISAWRRTA